MRGGGGGGQRGACVSPRSHFGQVALGREAEAVDRVGPAVGPLAELVGRLGEGHVGSDGAVDDGLEGRDRTIPPRSIRKSPFPDFSNPPPHQMFPTKCKKSCNNLHNYPNSTPALITRLK